jgi:hypothetical protein
MLACEVFFLPVSQPPSALTIAKDIATIVIALANLILASYVFYFQRKKNRNDIKLQWFKELIIEPNMPNIDKFYNNLSGLRVRIVVPLLGEDEKRVINDSIKLEAQELRKSYITLLMMFDSKLGTKSKDNIDELVDNITNALFNDELRLSHPNVYDREIGQKILVSKTNLLSYIYNYYGRSNS